jgi:hypothetical protein
MKKFVEDCLIVRKHKFASSKFTGPSGDLRFPFENQVRLFFLKNKQLQSHLLLVKKRNLNWLSACLAVFCANIHANAEKMAD